MTQQTGTAADAPASAPTDATKGSKPAGLSFAKWRNRGIVLVMIAVAVFVAVRIVRAQAVRDAKLDLGAVMLTSQPIPVETSLPGLVTSVDVRAGQRVTAGQELGKIEVTTTDSQGKAVVSERTLNSPRSGIVVDDPLTLGSTLQPGLAFVELYDPNKLTLVTDVPLSYLPQIAAGMTARLKANGLSKPIDAVLQRAVPRIGSGQNDVQKDHLELVFVPVDVSTVARLIPGLTFTGTIDTRTGKSGTERVVYVG